MSTDAEQDKNSTAVSQHARIGSTLENRYRILDVLAEGGMGVVYRGERLGLNRPVAVKFLHASFAADVKVRERFERELQAMSRLTHPNCISVVDYGIADSPFIVMEYVTGPTLRHMLADHGRLPPVRALFIASQILAALAHAHSQDMVHRDIKPGNIILSDIEGTLDHVYVLDFGLAKFLSGAANDDLTTSGMLLGTPSYMSPEQARTQVIGAATDIYATGVVLFELLTGTKPYTGKHALDILHHHQTAPVPSIRKRAPDANFSKALDDAIQTALAKDPAKRFPSAVAFSRALDQVPEAAAIRTSTKLRALTPPPGLDLPGASTPRSDAPFAAPAVSDLLQTIASPDAIAALPDASPAPVAAMPAHMPAQRPLQGAPITSSSTLSTLVPGALQPRATAAVPAASARREDTPLAIAIGPLGRFGTGPTRIAFAGAIIVVAGLLTWYAARDGVHASGQYAAVAQQDARVRSALAVAGPASPRQAEPDVQANELEAAAVEDVELEAAAVEDVEAEAAVEDVELEAAAVEDVELEAAAVAGEEPELAAVSATVRNEVTIEPTAAPPARASRQQEPARGAPVSGIDDIERLLQQGRRDEAIQGILLLRRTNFTRSGYLAFQLGNLYFDKMQWSNGLEAYDDALRLKPDYRSNPTLNTNIIRSLSHKQTWRKASALYVNRIRKGGVKYLREAAGSDKNGTVRQRAKQLLGRINKK